MHKCFCTKVAGNTIRQLHKRVIKKIYMCNIPYGGCHPPGSKNMASVRNTAPPPKGPPPYCLHTSIFLHPPRRWNHRGLGYNYIISSESSDVSLSIDFKSMHII